MTEPLEHDGVCVDAVEADAYPVDTDAPEADGTIAWNSTTIIVVRVRAGHQVGTGWTYGSPAIAALIRDTLTPLVVGASPVDTQSTWTRMVRSLRNIGRAGLGAMALSPVDIALWDLKARVLGVPLHRLLGTQRNSVPVYGSGGFTTYDHEQLRDQLQGWVATGAPAVKIKIAESWGTEADRDLRRVEQALEVIGPRVQLFVDANGGYTVGQAVRIGHTLDALGVTWFEEPVSSDDLPGLRTVRRATRLDVAAGEYLDSLDYARRMCQADAVDCLQVDVTRCGGITELLRVASVAAAHHLDVSAHCAPYLSAAAFAALPNLRHLEYFHDHARLEQLLFTGTPPMSEGALTLGDAPGHGMTLREERAASLG